MGSSERTQTLKDACQLPGLSSSPVRQHLQKHGARVGGAGTVPAFWKWPVGEKWWGQEGSRPSSQPRVLSWVLSVGTCPEPLKCPPKTPNSTRAPKPSFPMPARPPVPAQPGKGKPGLLTPTQGGSSRLGHRLEDGLLTGGEQPRNPARPQPGWEQLRQKALS